MCSTEMRAAPLPATRAARMNSRGQRVSAPARVTRAKTGTLKMPMAMIAFSAEGPKTAVIMMAMRSAGKAKTRSLPRRMTSSSKRAAPCGGGEAEGHAEADADADRDKRDGDRDPGADHEHREDVAAEVVGAEPVRRGRRLELGGDVERWRRPRGSRRRRARAARTKTPREERAEDEGAHQRRRRRGSTARVGEVDEEGDEDHGEDQEHDHRLHHHQVALADRLEHQPAEAGEEEDVLDDDRAGEQEGELQADDGEDRDQRVAERVAARAPGRGSGPWRGRCGCSPRRGCRSAPSA